MARVPGADATHVFNVPEVHQAPTDPGPSGPGRQVVTVSLDKKYNIGDEWLNTETGAYFKCTRIDEAGAAVWTRAGEAAELANAATIAYVDDADATLKQQVDEADAALQQQVDQLSLDIIDVQAALQRLQDEKLDRLGVTDGSEAPPGVIGEYKVTSNTVGVEMLSDTPTQVCPLHLEPGDWEIWGSVDFLPPGNVSPNMIAASVSVHPSELPSEDDLMTGVGILNMFTTTALTSGQRQVLMTGQCRSNSAAPLDLYLVAQTSFASGSATVLTKGYICARRAR